MVLANMGSNKKKTLLIVVSLSLPVVLLTVTLLFTCGFSMEKYLEEKIVQTLLCVGDTDHFRFRVHSQVAARNGVFQMSLRKFG